MLRINWWNIMNNYYVINWTFKLISISDWSVLSIISWTMEETRVLQEEMDARVLISLLSGHPYFAVPWIVVFFHTFYFELRSKQAGLPPKKKKK